MKGCFAVVAFEGMICKSLLIFYGIVCLSFVLNTAARGQQVFKTTQTSVIAYLEYLPQDYRLNSNKYPVVIFLHGIGERGPNTQDLNVLSQSIQEVAKLGPPMYVKNGNQFPFILISPQLKDNYSNWPSDYVLEVINYVKTYLKIDEKRIYLTGLSLGGGGAWWTAQDYPELFAALAPVCGGRNTPAAACAIAKENLPVWAFHGDKDTIVPLATSVNMVNAINNCVPAPDPQAKMTIYPEVGHSSWTYAYKIDKSIHDPNVYEWMLSFRNTVNAGNRIPEANAGEDKIVTNTSITIVGSGSDLEGNISYLWTQLQGPSVATLENKTSSSLQASNLMPGEYLFSLRVTDNGSASDTDYVIVKIDNGNLLPVANAGSDKTVCLPTNSIQIIGSGSDSDGTISAYEWCKISGPSATLTDANAPILTASDLLSGPYVFRLMVTDDKEGKHYDEMSLLINEPVAPIANAGPNKLVILPANSISIIGSATDSDGSIALYQWSQRTGGACTMTNTTSSTLNVSDLKSDSYIFRLTVADNMGFEDYDDVLINVTFPPVVDAGADQLVNLPLASVILTGSAWDPDGTIKTYAWSKYSGPSALLTNKSTSSLTITDLKEGTYVFKLRVSDNLTAKTTDYVTLTVKKVILTISSSTSTSIKIKEKDVDSFVPTDPRENNKAILEGLTSLDLENCIVSVFNESGVGIFSGVWTLEQYKETFSQNRLYIYHVYKAGRRIESGKIYIRD